ncbi:S-layer homology domain-containing protein [Thiolapillus sp.]
MEHLISSIGRTILVANFFWGASLADAAVGDTFRVSESSTGVPAQGDSDYISLSSNGRIICFASSAPNLIADDGNHVGDVFVHDLLDATTTRVSVSTGGTEGNALSEKPSLSADGRFVAFVSAASNLVDNDTNGVKDIFVRDRLLGTTARISLSGSGVQANGASDAPAISADGRFVAFFSEASNLVNGDANNAGDVFVHDMQEGTTVRVSVSSSGVEGNAVSDMPVISADGNVVAFSSLADNLVDGDSNLNRDVFVHDMQSGQTKRVSLNEMNGQASGSNEYPSLSADGHYVAFTSYDSLVAIDTNGMPDIYVRDTQAAQTFLVSVDSSGNVADIGSHEAHVSGDGRYVAFTSLASNLVPGDSNGNPDVFIHDRQSGVTTRVSVSTSGVEANNGAASPAISQDGRFVAFRSDSASLDPAGTGEWKDVYEHQYLPYLFTDVPVTYWAYDEIQTLGDSGVTAGCDIYNYCPDDVVTRGQMAVFLERGLRGSSFMPPVATGTMFADVGVDYWSASWIEQLAQDQITAGCDSNNYCPDNEVTRAEMAVFLLRSRHGATYVPPAASGTLFSDVPAGYWAGAWIEQLVAEGISTGCGGGQFCPDAVLNRGQMAVFLIRTFNL